MPHPTPVAYMVCKKSHLRRDAKALICTRYMAANLQCNYTPSRRGDLGLGTVAHISTNLR
ncbi:uncharacterized protein K444DRAFT_611253 [Hyaloscypha bicolor E]|uniref:Uncharacterized protein n=1 Tax=Hyaloscypha bicolor E TaxID=1095630 RepID=A0A2J6TG97_9HELO|nr:uncharacterized protein K444DRAFT_611253 [Hyaloscypha bicolor E]PMD62046.1 hypothetical protein K444DRAFT_611253 [Hyaloscypha bicolor E]